MLTQLQKLENLHLMHEWHTTVSENSIGCFAVVTAHFEMGICQWLVFTTNAFLIWQTVRVS